MRLLAQRAPALFLDVKTEFLGSRLNPLKRLFAFGIADLLLIPASLIQKWRVGEMTTSPTQNLPAELAA
jgi:hypothetical protein